jgi:glycosidase
MGIITGNHDKARFISYAGGALSFDEDAKRAGWTRTVGVGDTIGYNKLQLLNAFIFTIPGVPTIYQGDEFGQPGANDPDNRKMMQFGNLLPKEEETLQITKKLAHLRRGNMALCYGTFDPLLVNDSSYAFARTYFGNKVIVVFNNSASPSNMMINLPKGLQGISWQSNFGSSYTENDGTLEINLRPYAFEVLTSR